MGWNKSKRKDDGSSSTKLDGTRLERYPEWARMVKRTARAQQAAMIWEHFVGYASDETTAGSSTEAEKMAEPKVPESTETAKAMADRLWAASHTPTNPGGLASKITTPEAKAAWSSVDTQAKLHGDREHIAEGILKDALDCDLLVQVKTAPGRVAAAEKARVDAAIEADATAAVVVAMARAVRVVRAPRVVRATRLPLRRLHLRLHLRLRPRPHLRLRSKSTSRRARPRRTNKKLPSSSSSWRTPRGRTISGEAACS